MPKLKLEMKGDPSVPDLVRALEAESLATVDLLGVEILSTGGPVHGVGSPPAGDHWTSDDLRGMADAATELADEVKAPAKIGHKGGDPAVGWLDNVRVNADGSRLLADIKRVPKGLSSLIDAGAYRTRSVELRAMTSQKTGRQYPWVVSGLAWLGGKMPAVRTLGDVVKLYEADEDAERKFVEIAETDVDTDGLRDAVADLGRQLAESSGKSLGDPDSSHEMPKYTDEQRRTFAEATGLEVEKVTDELLDKTAETLKIEPAPEPEARELEADERIKSLEDKLETSDQRSRSLEEKLATTEQRNFVEGLFRSGKAEPGQRAEIEKMYEASPEAAHKFFETVKPNDDLSREYGSDEDDDNPSDEENEKRDLAEREYIAREFDIPVEEVA